MEVHTFPFMYLCFLHDDGWMERQKRVVGKQTNEYMVFKCHVCMDLNHYYNTYGSFLSSMIYSKNQTRCINTDIVVYCIWFHIFKLYKLRICKTITLF